MATETLPPETILFRRLYTSTTVHVIDLAAPRHPEDQPGRELSLCRTRPFWPGVWIEAMQDVENLCKTCELTLEASLSVSA